MIDPATVWRRARGRSRLVDIASALIAARSDDAYHTVAAAARAENGTVVSGVNVYHFTRGPVLADLLPYPFNWDPDRGTSAGAGGRSRA